MVEILLGICLGWLLRYVQEDNCCRACRLRTEIAKRTAPQVEREEK